MFDNCTEAASPFFDGMRENYVYNTTTQINYANFLDEIDRRSGVVSFDEEYVTDDGDENIKESVNDGADFDFTATFPSGENDEKRSRENNGKSNKLHR